MRKPAPSLAETGKRFKIALSQAGLSQQGAAKEFHVTQRTIQNWLNGKTRVPASALHLARILSKWAIPLPQWQGWCFHSGKLWTPEGRAIGPHDGSWWSLLVRQARGFMTLVEERRRLETELSKARKAGYLQPDYLGIAAPSMDAQRHAGSGEAAGLVPVSTTQKRLPNSIESDINIASGLYQADIQPGYNAKYHNDYVLISCPTRFAYPSRSTAKPVPVHRPSASASTPLCALPWTTTCAVDNHCTNHQVQTGNPMPGNPASQSPVQALQRPDKQSNRPDTPQTAKLSSTWPCSVVKQPPTENDCANKFVPPSNPETAALHRPWDTGSAPASQPSNLLDRASLLASPVTYEHAEEIVDSCLTLLPIAQAVAQNPECAHWGIEDFLLYICSVAVKVYDAKGASAPDLYQATGVLQ